MRKIVALLFSLCLWVTLGLSVHAQELDRPTRYVTQEDAFIQAFEFRENHIVVTVNTAPKFKDELVSLAQFQQHALDIKLLNPSNSPEEMKRLRTEYGLNIEIPDDMSAHEAMTFIQEHVPGIYFTLSNIFEPVFVITGAELRTLDNKTTVHLFNQPLFSFNQEGTTLTYQDTTYHQE